MEQSPMLKWLPVRDALNMLRIGRTTLYRRITTGEIQTVKRNGKVFVAVPHDVPLESQIEQLGTDGTANGTAEMEYLRRENDALRGEVKRLHVRIEHLESQNERLTLLLANEQAQRMKALPSPIWWFRRLFRRDG